LIPAVAWVGTELFDRRTAVVAALFTAVAPVLVWYSQEARDYALAALFATITIGAGARVGRRGKAADWALYTIAAALAVWSDWFGAFMVVGTELALAVALRRRWRASEPIARFVTSWLLSTLALASQLVPLAFLAVKQGHNGLAGFTASASVGASGVSFYSTVSNLSWALFGFHPATVTQVLAAVWPLVMLGTLLLVGRGLSRRPLLLAAFAVLPVIGLLILALFTPGTFDVRYLVITVPPVILLWARMATSWSRSQTGRFLAVGGVLVVLAAALVDQQLDPNNPRRYDYQQALARVRAQSREGGVVLFEPRSLSAEFAHYAAGLREQPLTVHLPTRARASSVQVVTSFTNQPRYRALRDREIGALRATRRFVSRHRYPGVDVWWFR
jgi:4-amino-4-deoxy-L-arabinose transferase-like glycosyltransferase